MVRGVGPKMRIRPRPNKEMRVMQKTLRLKTTVLPGGRVEFASSELEPGQTVEVVVLHESTVSGRSVMEILNSGPDERLFRTAEEVREYLAEEKASWERWPFPLPGWSILTPIVLYTVWNGLSRTAHSLSRCGSKHRMETSPS